ncbi:MAG: hypothetical protein K2X74_19705 [Acetobacteraceae bacterium]|nr:hypothetical protein [Acetobacteraceae bacterium]
MTRTFAAVALAATLTAFAGQASAQSYDWQGQSRGWTPPPSSTRCVLELNRIYQPSPGQPIHLVITNRSGVRVQYTLNIVLRKGNQVTTGQIFVDNANSGERSERPRSSPSRAICAARW